MVLYREKYPPNVLANRFLELAAAHPHHPIAITALGLHLPGGDRVGDPQAPIAKAREQAIDR